MDQLDLWNVLQYKLCKDYLDDFAHQNVESWLSHFLPDEVIKVTDCRQEIIVKRGGPKVIKAYNGGFWKSMRKGCISTKIMAKVNFRKLEKEGYGFSKVALIRIREDKLNPNHCNAYTRYERYNVQGDAYDAGINGYDLQFIGENWYIGEITIYDNDLKNLPNLGDMWYVLNKT